MNPTTTGALQRRIARIDRHIRFLRQKHWRMVERCLNTAEVDEAVDALLERRLELMEA